MRRLIRGLGLVLAALLTGAEALLVWKWLEGRRYLLQYGALENPYAAEDTAIIGFFALALLPLWLAAVTWAFYETVLKEKTGGSPRGETEAKNDADNLL